MFDPSDIGFEKKVQIVLHRHAETERNINKFNRKWEEKHTKRGENNLIMILLSIQTDKRKSRLKVSKQLFILTPF